MSKALNSCALRKRIARDVMGWHDVSRSWAYTGEATLWYDEEDIGLMPVQAWRPDEDDAQCMAVLARMRALGYEFELASSGSMVRAAFTTAHDKRGEARDEDLRTALLVAALAAVAHS